MKCVICNKEYEGYGNNAEPIAKGMCCDNCNTTYVIPARLKQLEVEKKLEDSSVEDAVVGFIVQSVYGTKEYRVKKEEQAVAQYLKDFPRAKKEDVTVQGIGTLDTPKDKMIFENRDAETTEDVKRREIGNLIREEVNAVESYDNTVPETILTAAEKRILEHIRNEEIEHTDELNSIYKNLKSEDVQDDSNLKESFAGQYDPADVNEPVEAQDDGFSDVFRKVGNAVSKFAGYANKVETSENFDSDEKVEKMKDGFIRYKGYDIEYNFYGKGEYTVQYQGDDVWFKTEQEAKKFIDEISGIKDDAQEVQPTLEENEISNSIQDDLDRDIYEGWTPRDFINELEPQFGYAVNRFNSKDDVKEWCMSNQPYYKKYIPEVVSYFVKKWESAKNNSLYDNAEIYDEEVEEQIEALSENTVEARDSKDYSQYVGRNLYEVAKELGITGWNKVDDFFTYTFYNGNQSIEFETDGRGTIKGVKANMKDCNTVRDEETFTDYYKAKKRAEQLGLKEAEYGDLSNGTAYCYWNKSGDRNDDAEVYVEYRWGKDGKPIPLHDSDTVNDIGMYAKGDKYRWDAKYGNAQLTLMCVCEDDSIKLSLDNADLYVKLPREKFEEMLRNKTIVSTDTLRIDGYDRIKAQDKKFIVKVGDRKFIVKAKDSLDARNKIKAKFAK